MGTSCSTGNMVYSSERWDMGEQNMDRVDAYQNISRYPNIQAMKLHVVFLYLASTDDLHFVPLFSCSFTGHISLVLFDSSNHLK